MVTRKSISTNMGVVPYWVYDSASVSTRTPRLELELEMTTRAREISANPANRKAPRSVEITDVHRFAREHVRPLLDPRSKNVTCKSGVLSRWAAMPAGAAGSSVISHI